VDVSEAKLIYEGMPDLLPMEGRSPGVHVSDIIHDLCVKLGHYEDRDNNGEVNAFMGLGSALEHAVVHRFALDEPDRYLQVGELEMDGIFGTPDLLDTKDWALTEIKLTWMSSRHEPDSEKFWRYWVQIKAYCAMMVTTVGRLHVCHVMGDYKGSGPTYRIWECRFSDQELAENWAMLRTHGEKLGEL
jgi:hypothetical protein